jgi:hypothetical protein
MSKMKKINSVIGVFQYSLDLSKVYCFRWSSYSCNGVIITIITIIIIIIIIIEFFYWNTFSNYFIPFLIPTLLFSLSHQNGHIGAFSYSKIKIEIDMNNDELLAIIWKILRKLKGKGEGMFFNLKPC